MANLRQQILIITILLLLLAVPFSNAVNSTNYESVFRLVDRPGGSVSYSLTLSITSSLYNYFVGQNHDVYSSADFAKFITPYSVKPIADALWNVTSDDEVFTDAVLSIAQQIPYEVSPEVYPVETLKLNYGDCASFSFLVASILKAGGLNVVLLEYPSEHHMNVGVSLPHEPVYAGSNVAWVEYNDTRYYIAETTGDDFPKGWRVGECPTNLSQASPNVIPVENSEQISPGQVSASYKPLSPSQISISVFSSVAMEDEVITIAGIVSPSNSGNVSIYTSSFGGNWQVLATTAVGADGRYLYQWRPTSGGIYYLEASWPGNADYAGANSAQATLYVIPFYGLVAGVLGLLLIVLILVFWLMNRRGATPSVAIERTEPPAPPPPEEKPQAAQEETETPPSQTSGETTRQEDTKSRPSQTTTAETTTQTQEPQQTIEKTSTTPPQTHKPQQTEGPNQSMPQPAEEQKQPEPSTQEQTSENYTENPT